MSLYAIGDFHLSFSVDKPMDVFGREWKKHEKKIEKASRKESPFTQMTEEYGTSKVIYSHCHGKERFDDSFKGYVNGIKYMLVSGDYLKFKPELILR